MLSPERVSTKTPTSGVRLPTRAQITFNTKRKYDKHQPQLRKQPVAMQGDFGAPARGQDNYCNRGSAPIRLLPPNLTHSRPHKARRANFTKVHNNGQRQTSYAILPCAKLKAEYCKMDSKIHRCERRFVLGVGGGRNTSRSEEHRIPRVLGY